MFLTNGSFKNLLRRFVSTRRNINVNTLFTTAMHFGWKKDISDILCPN